MGSLTLKDVAKVAGVSYATVSRALSGSSEIGEKTRQRVLKLCEEMGYTPNSVARSMVMKRTNIIGLILASIDNPFMSELTVHLEIYARKRGYNLMVCNSSYNQKQERDVFRLLLSRKVDGIIILPISHGSHESLKSLTAQVPTVFVSENMQDLPENYISIDNTQGMQIATEYLYSLGHRKILYLGARKKSVTHSLRVEGYISTCRKLGIEPKIIESSYPRSSHEFGYLLARDYFSEAHDETAILCASDALAIGVMHAAYEKGIRIPQDLSLMGFDNISFASLPTIDLTTINQPKQELATLAMDMLVSHIDGTEPDFTCKLVSPSLVVRGSCLKLNNQANIPGVFHV